MRMAFKVIAVIAVLAFVGVEVGSPLWSRTEVSLAASDSATAGADNFFTNHDFVLAQQAAADAASADGSKLESFDSSATSADGKVHVTVSRQAKSYVLYRIKALRKWYEVKASASATPAAS